MTERESPTFNPEVPAEDLVENVDPRPEPPVSLDDVLAPPASSVDNRTVEHQVPQEGIMVTPDPSRHNDQIESPIATTPPDASRSEDADFQAKLAEEAEYVAVVPAEEQDLEAVLRPEENLSEEQTLEK